MEENKEGFTVHDRRAASQEEEQARPEGKPGSETPEPGERRTAPLPPVDFSSFILTLAASAQAGLGLLPDPRTKVAEQNLPAAKQVIDVIGMLKEKTAGNLGPEEQEIVDSVLAGLRMLYVKALEGKK